MYTIDHKQQSGLLTRLINICLLLVAAVFSNAAMAAEAEDTETTAYVDSVHSWGSWALGIEPAAGPQSPQNVPMNNRSANIHFRPNDNATYSTVAIPQNVPPTPPLPVGPPGLIPTSGPVPVGGPFFPGS